MAGSFTAVDLSQLKPPAVVQQLNFETVLAEAVADLQARYPEFSALVESDPAFKILEACAYREMLVRADFNNGCYAVMLAFATGADLDQLGANVSVPRLVITPANPNSVPPTTAILEDDAAYRYRVQNAFQGYSVAGPEGAYIFHGMSADGRVKDISAVSPSPGVVSIYVLSREAGGVPTQAVLDAVAAAVNADTIRPLTDNVNVYAASIVPYQVKAELVLFPGPDAGVIVAAAIRAVNEYADSVQKLGYEVALSGLYRALHQAGVKQVNLLTPTSTIEISPGQAAVCTDVSVTFVVGD